MENIFEKLGIGKRSRKQIKRIKVIDDKYQDEHYLVIFDKGDYAASIIDDYWANELYGDKNGKRYYEIALMKNHHNGKFNITYDDNLFRDVVRCCDSDMINTCLLYIGKKNNRKAA